AIASIYTGNYTTSADANDEWLKVVANCRNSGRTAPRDRHWIAERLKGADSRIPRPSFPS
ncbi:hypothetical protein, partial [Novosphingobium resinovorum]|uniref:hypothetical protein n=1 Tax=Novosphingobium resinovorum TaxID=158500 RepID=UPI0022F2913F